MGFDSSIKLLKKYRDEPLEFGDTLHLYNYCKFLKWVDSDWCKKQTENGYTFNFEDSYPVYKGKEHTFPPNAILFYKRLVAEENEYADDDVAYWCSAGRYIHELIQDNSHAVYERSYDGYYEITPDDIPKIEKAVNSWLEEHKLIPVTVNYGLRCNDDDSVTCIPIDGIEVETADGYTKKLYEDSEIFIPAKYCDEDERYAYESLLSALQKLKNVDLNEYYVYYCGGN